MPAIRDRKLVDALRLIGDPELENDPATNDPKVCEAVLTAIGHVGLLGIDRGEMDRCPALSVTQTGPTAKRTGLTDEQKYRVRRAWTATAQLAWETTSKDVFNPADTPSILDKADDAHELFRRNASEISAALLLAALPQTYATAWGARVLAAAGGMRSGLRGRIRRTAQFLVYAMTPDPDPQSDASREYFEKLPKQFRWSFEAAVSLRLFHHAMRTQLNGKAGEDDDFRSALGPRNTYDPGAAKEQPQNVSARGRTGTANPQGDKVDNAPRNVPLNQEDLLGTLLTFTITVFETLERFGMPWTADEQETYLNAWDVIGSWMGIGTSKVVAELLALDETQLKTLALDQDQLKKMVEAEPAVERRGALRPATVTDARAWLTQLRRRQWLEVEVSRGGANLLREWDSLQPGRLLLRALLEELDVVMSPMRGGWPLSVMRQLADDRVRDRLGLGGGGIIQAALEALPRKTTMADDITSLRVRNRVATHVVRFMANSVTQQTVVHFVEHGDPPFEFPTMFDEGAGTFTH